MVIGWVVVPSSLLGATAEWPQRLMLTLVVAGAIACCLLLMWLGWVRRGRRQGDIAAPARMPQLPAERLSSDVTGIAARYLGANRCGDWLDRVVVHGLGVPSPARVSVRGTDGGGVGGVWIHRVGAPNIFIPADDVVGARHDRGAAGRAYGAQGVLVICADIGMRRIELGLRVRDAALADRLRVVIDAIAVVVPVSGDAS